MRRSLMSLGEEPPQIVEATESQPVVPAEAQAVVPAEAQAVETETVDQSSRDFDSSDDEMFNQDMERFTKASNLGTWVSPHVPLFNGQTLLDAVTNGYIVGGVPRAVDDEAVSLSDFFTGDDTQLELPLQGICSAPMMSTRRSTSYSLCQSHMGVIASLFPWTWTRQWRM